MSPLLHPKSHPAVQFENIPLITGPLSDLDQKRQSILQDVVQSTLKDPRIIGNAENLLSEALYNEKVRLRKTGILSPSFWFTFGRQRADRNMVSHLRRGLLKAPAQGGREELLHALLSHYAEEIGGHFDPKVYRFAVTVVPLLFNWLLNAASLRRLIPGSNVQTMALQKNLSIVGAIPQLQKLSQRGTIMIVPTHQSNIDSILIGSVIWMMGLPPFAYGAGLNLFSNPVLSYMMGNLGAYTVDREKGQLLYKEVLKNYSTRILCEGMHSIFFPGGGRCREGAIESSLKLGLLGTALQAQIHNLQQEKRHPKIFIVPMVMSYHFVLEASSLIESYLHRQGRHLFMGADVERIFPLVKFFKFFHNIFYNQSAITVRIGRPLDVFGNAVDENGESIGPNGTIIDIRKWLTTNGKLQSQEQRDRQYSRRLGDTIVERYYKENTVLSSHLVAFAFFRALRKKYPDLSLYRFLRLSSAQRSLSFEDLLRESAQLREEVLDLEKRGELYLSENLRQVETRAWVLDGIHHLGLFHGTAVVKVQDDVVSTGDMNLLYYYRNRLSGYGLSLRAREGRGMLLRGKTDEQGFLG